MMQAGVKHRSRWIGRPEHAARMETRPGARLTRNAKQDELRVQDLGRGEKGCKGNVRTGL